MPDKLTYHDAQHELRKLGLILIRKDGEYKVNFRGGKEGTAYFTNELDDALATGKKMAEAKVEVFQSKWDKLDNPETP